MTSASLSYLQVPAAVPLLPLDKGLAGPVTAQRWRRTLGIYAALFAIGTTLATFGGPHTASFGLGLIVPGGGFLMHAASPLASAVLHVGLFAGTLLLFAVALFLWIATGNLIAPIITWLGAAIAAATMEHWHGVPYSSLGAMWRTDAGLISGTDPRVWLPLLMGGIGLAGFWRFRARLPQMQADARRINHFLAEARTPITRDIDPATGIARVHPVERRDLELHRFLLDRALQPVAEFNGFEDIDEFREAAKRYQLCNSSFMQSVNAYIHAPAFHGYQLRAQQNLAKKMMDHRVWSYWRLENLWGNLRSDPDPLTRDNIMYSGWFAAMLGMHQMVFGDEQFSEPGSIRLEHPSGQTFVSSFPDLCRILLQNMRSSDFCLFPCEPRWVYPMCNNFGALALKCHDRLYATDYWEQIRGRYQQSLEDEFITLEGRITAIRDYRTGMTVPALTATMADAVTALFMHPVLPELAARSWNIIRHDLVRMVDGRTELLTNGWDKIDFGNYRRSFLTTYALTAAAAREMGDDEVADGLLRRIEEEFPSQTVEGVRHYPRGSTSAHAVIYAARILHSNGFHDLVNVGLPEAWRRGPILEDARYPEVLVAGAVAEGEGLRLHLATDTGRRNSELGLARLKPHAEYRIMDSNGAPFRADAHGKARITVELSEAIRPFHIGPAH